MVCRGTLLLAALAACLCAARAKQERVEFKIVPNAAGSVSVALDTPPIAGSTCTFEWDATGATTELWAAEVSGNPASGDLGCDVARAGGKQSYLMFRSFKTTLGTSDIIDAEVFGNDGAVDGAHAIDGECVKNHHEWPGGVIRRIKLTSAVDY